MSLTARFDCWQGELSKGLPCRNRHNMLGCTLNTAVAFVIFKRPDLTARVWEAIRHAHPQKLFLIADGPRTPEEQEKCDEARRVVEQVDWKCEVHRNYSATNLGCRDRIVSGLDWIFSQVNEAIVLEDDCVPAQSFFGFCAELLDHYRDEDRIMHICGTNFIGGAPTTSDPYYFSKYADMWGWATWARAWRHMDLKMKLWPDFVKERSKKLFTDEVERKHWIRKLNRFFTGKRIDSWAYPWQFAVWMQRGVCISPAINLVTNIGYRADATHTQAESPRANLPAGELALPLKHPLAIRINEEADHQTFNAALGGDRLRKRQTWRHRFSKPLRVWRKLRATAGTA
jgi:hypothetical protein